MDYNKIKEELRKVVTQDTVFACVGTNKVVFDMFGPLCGELLKRKNIPYYGDYKYNINSVTMYERLEEMYIINNHENTNIIAIDAAVTDDEEKINKLEISMIKEIGEFKTNFSHSLTEDFNNQTERLDNRLRLINDKVNERLDENFEKTNKTFANVLERLSKIDEAQKKIDTLSGDIVSLQSVLTDKKSRGIFGEVNLNYILTSVFGDKNDKVYQLQYTLPNCSIADSVLRCPEPLGLVCIDSKFPLENYQRMMDKTISDFSML